MTTRGEEIVHARERAYGPGTSTVREIAELWSSVLGVEVTPLQVCHMMILLKVARERVTHHADNLDDIEGYIVLAGKVHDESRPHTSRS